MMYGLPASLKPLSQAEEQVMLAVWQAKPPVTSAAAAEQLAQKGWAATTLLSFLSRLEQKGWLKCSRQGGRNVYCPCVTLRAYRAAVARERLASVFGGSLPVLLSALLSEQALPQGQLETALTQLQEKLAEMEDYDLYGPYG